MGENPLDNGPDVCFVYPLIAGRSFPPKDSSLRIGFVRLAVVGFFVLSGQEETDCRVPSEQKLDKKLDFSTALRP